MLYLQTVTPDTLELLRGLLALPEMRGLRLVGGTALALHNGGNSNDYKETEQ